MPPPAAFPGILNIFPIEIFLPNICKIFKIFSTLLQHIVGENQKVYQPFLSFLNSSFEFFIDHVGEIFFWPFRKRWPEGKSSQWECCVVCHHNPNGILWLFSLIWLSLVSIYFSTDNAKRTSMKTRSNWARKVRELSMGKSEGRHCFFIHEWERLRGGRWSWRRRNGKG